MRLSWAGGLLGAGLLVQTAAAVGLHDATDGWLHRPREVPAAADSFASAGAGWLACGGGRLFSLPELPLGYLGAGWSGRWGGRQVDLEGDLQDLGSDLVRERTWGVRILVGGARGAGLGITCRRLTVGGRPLAADWTGTLTGRGTWNWGAGWRGQGEIHLDWPPSGGAGADPVGRRPLARAVVGGGIHSLAVAVDRGRDGALACTLEFLLELGHRVHLTVLTDGATGAVGPGLGVARGSLLVLTSHLQHPALGATHRVMVVVGGWSRAWW